MNIRQTKKLEIPIEKVTSKNNSQSIQFKNNRPETTAQLKVQEMVNQPIQRQENKTGMPDNLKSGIENLSGLDMSDVKVHYNSPQPAQLQAHAFAQGNQIHIASGQEKHLPHEAWHVVQQKQGRVQTTKQLKGKVNINDDSGLEREADVMGAKALQTKTIYVDSLPAVQLQSFNGITGLSYGNLPIQKQSSTSNPTIQFYRSSKGIQAHITGGNTTLVTQFYLGESILSPIGTAIGEVTNVITHPAILLLTEFIAAFTGGLILMKINPSAGLAAMSTGIAKYLRFCEIAQKPDGPPTAKSKEKMNQLRLLESCLAGLLAVMSIQNTTQSVTTKISAGIFAALKFTRSLFLFGDWGLTGKILLHVVQILEGAAVAIAGYNWDSPETSTSARNIGMTIGASKVVRGIRGIYDDVSASQSSLPQDQSMA